MFSPEKAGLTLYLYLVSARFSAVKPGSERMLILIEYCSPSISNLHLYVSAFGCFNSIHRIVESIGKRQTEVETISLLAIENPLHSLISFQEIIKD
jgi:hypothetical protein